jgi:hypothetical protein
MSDFIFSAAAERQLEILRFTQNDNNIVFVLTLQCFNELQRFSESHA